MGGEKPGWYYVGKGQLRYHDGGGWTDRYKPIEGPRTALTPMVDESSDPAGSNESPDVKKPRRRMSSLVIAVCVGLVGVGGGLLKPDVFHRATSWATGQAGQISALISPPAPAAQAIAVKPVAKAKVKVPAKATPPKTVAAPVATHAPSAKTVQVASPPAAGAPSAALSDFDKAYARIVTADLVDSIRYADGYFLDSPEIGTSGMMGFLSADMERLLNAGIPPVADKAHYYALVTTLEKFYGTAADQLPDDVIGAAATYTVARELTSELLGLLNPILGTKYALATWSFM